jgi:phosphoesterase RecJ-like protein
MVFRSRGVRLSVMIYERKDSIKLSFRSLGNVNVNELARKYFDGGGHKNASGGTSSTTLEQTLQKLLTILPEYKEKLIVNE